MLLMKLFYTAVWMKQRATLGAQIAVVRDGQILLVRHSYKPGWYLPGGGVDPPEAPEATAVRELLEETGCRLLSPPRLLGIIPNVSPATKRDYIVAFMATEIDEGALQPSWEIAEIAWFPLDRIPSNVHDMVSTVLERVRQLCAGAGDSGKRKTPEN